MENLQNMNENYFKGFTVIELIVSLVFFTIISSSIYLMSSYLISSTKIISNEYLSEILYKSYLERLKINSEINDKFEDQIYSKNGYLSFQIIKVKTPNSVIFKIQLIPKSSNQNKIFETYWSSKWDF